MNEREAQLVASLPSGLFIGGEWRAAAGGRIFDVVDPATDEVIADVADGSAADAVAALDAAVAAAPAWAATAPRVRAEILRRSFDLLLGRTEDFATIMALEMGKPLAEARGEVAYGAEFLRWFSEEAVRISGRFGVNPEGTGQMMVSRHPVGPCFLITPWNFPLAMATRKIAPALAAGCTVVIKPAALTPLTTLLFVRVLQEAGLPAGVVNVITSSSARVVSSPIIADHRLRKLSFTGSTEVGRQLIGQSATGVLRTSMELGGNAPFIVFADADLDRAVDGAIQAKFRNSGQACTAANRFIVHESIVEYFADALRSRVEALTVGPGTDPETTIGPLIDQAAVESVHALVLDAVARGARLVVGGHPLPGPGTFYAPTVLTEVMPGSAILTEEIFGPVLAIASFHDEEEAIAMANDTEYGLVAYAYTRDLDRGQRLIDRLETGMLGLNAGLLSNAAAPFGGVKQSGMGREGGIEGIQEYLTTKYTLSPTTATATATRFSNTSGEKS
jgi:succinate-semialdehyde dehydrogenase/glutarate-semialdehyde dehydrogenase